MITRTQKLAAQAFQPQRGLPATGQMDMVRFHALGLD